MRKSAALATGLLLIAPQAFAISPLPEPRLGAETCFVRRYDAAHLAQNPGQRTLSMRMAFRHEIIPGSVGVAPLNFLRLEIVRRGDGRPWRAIAGCGFDKDANHDTDPNSSTFGRLRNPAYPRKDAIACQVTGEGLDAEGGDFILEDVGSGLRVYINDSITMRTGPSVRSGPGRLVAFGGGDGVFRLDRAPNTACADLHKALRFE